MAIEANDAESAAGFDLLIADYTEMLKNAETIPQEKVLYYKVQEKLDSLDTPQDKRRKRILREADEMIEELNSMII